MNISIRAERTDDVPTIRFVHDAAFGGPAEGRIVDDLRGTDAWLPSGSLVAEDQEAGVVGHLLLSGGRLARPNGAEALVGIIGPVGVLPERQHRGIGAALMWRAIDAARELRLPAVCLLGHAGYYPRFGFEPARSLGLEAPRAWADENWLALRLPTWTVDLRGVVRFPTAFADA